MIMEDIGLWFSVDVFSLLSFGVGQCNAILIVVPSVSIFWEDCGQWPLFLSLIYGGNHQ